MRCIFKILFTLAATLLMIQFIAIAASAAPAFEKSQEFTQPSGEKFKAELIGDEWFNYTQTDTGSVVTKGLDGYWFYAVPDDTNGITASNSKYIIDKKPANALSKEDMPAIREKQLAKKPNSQSMSVPNPNMSVSLPHAIGAQKALVLLVSFSDVPINYSESSWSNEFFGTSGKTVRTYYREVSGNQLDIVPASETYGTSGDGVVKVTLPYAHPNTSNIIDSRNQAIVRDALIVANPYVDFSSFDSNHDGYISTAELHIITVIAGYESSYSYSTPGIWAHHWSINGTITPPTLDGVSLCNGSGGGGYVQIGERHYDHMATIGTVCHELGHDLGLPDLYDTVDSNGTSEGVGYFSLMGSGNWCYDSTYGEAPGTTPSHLDGWCKMELGFVTPAVVSNGSYNVNSVSSNYNLLRINTTNPNEYFLVENREYDGFDKGLSFACNTGIAIWHIDESVIQTNFATDTVNGDENHKGVDLEEANYISYGGSQLDDDNSRGLPYDDLYQLNGLFSPDTAPYSNLYSGAPTGIRIAIPHTVSHSMIVNVGPLNSIGAITGNALVDDTLTAGSLSLTDATVTYQWQRADTSTGTFTNITGATGYIYTPTDDDIGKYVRATATGSGLYIGSAISDAVGPIKKAISNIDFPSGAARVGQLLTAGTITPTGATVTYQWMSAGGNYEFTDISGAISRTYTLTSVDAGKYIRVRVIGAGNYTGQVMSPWIGPVGAGALTGWVTNNEETYYYENGNPAVGWREINGFIYYFNNSGVMLTGWQQLEGYTRYFTNQGYLVKGWKEIDGHIYYFNEYGRMLTGWQLLIGYVYYFESNGYLVKGWREINGQIFYFNDYGRLLYNWQLIDGYVYFFDENGYLVKGWREINGHIHYFNNYGRLLYGWQLIYGYVYYFDENGYLVKGWREIGGHIHYFNEYGRVLYGWQLLDGYVYYFDESAFLVKGWRTIYGQTFYFNNYGRLQYNWQLIDGHVYFFDENGFMVKGWRTMYGHTFYFNGSGQLLYGRQVIDGVTYNFDENGYLIS